MPVRTFIKKICLREVGGGVRRTAVYLQHAAEIFGGGKFGPRFFEYRNVAPHSIGPTMSSHEPELDQFSIYPWSFDVVYVAEGYVCPLCQISSGPTDPGKAQLEFGLCRAISPTPVCEVCYVELPYLLTTLPGELLHPPRTALIRLTELRGVADERLLMIEYIAQQLASMGRLGAFDAHLADVRTRSSRKPLTRRRAKKAWKAIIDRLQTKLSKLRAMRATRSFADASGTAYRGRKRLGGAK